MRNAPRSVFLLCLFAYLGAGSSLAARAQSEDDDRRYEEEREDYTIPLDGDAPDDRTPQSLLFVPLLARDDASANGARGLSRMLTEGLAQRRHLDVYRMSQVPPIYDGDKDVSASLYMRGCPADEELGCQLILGEKSKVDRVVSGTYEQLTDSARVTITILNVPLAELEYSFEVILAVGLNERFLEAMELTLEQLADPFDDNEVVDEVALAQRERERRHAAKERNVMRAMDLALPESAFQLLDSSRGLRREQITEEDLVEQEQAELVSTDWEQVGLTKSQYVRWHNSRLSIDVWKERAANHFPQPLIGLGLGYLYGPVYLDYQGNYLLDEDPRNVIDSRSVLQPFPGHAVRVSAMLGFGFTTFLDFEFVGSLMYSRLNAVIQEYEYTDDTLTTVEPEPTFTDSGSQIRLYELQWKVRFYPVAVWRIKPTVAAGFGLLIYPNMGKGEGYSGPWYYAPDEPFVDHLMLIEPGAVIELSRHLAITADLTLGFSLKPAVLRTAVVDPYPEAVELDPHVPEPAIPSPAFAGFRIGLQVRPFRARLPEARNEEFFDDGI